MFELLIVFAACVFIKDAVVDVAYAVRGDQSPRYKLRMEKLKAKQAPGYTRTRKGAFREYVNGLWEDSWETAQTRHEERRAAKQAKRAEQGDVQDERQPRRLLGAITALARRPVEPTPRPTEADPADSPEPTPQTGRREPDDAPTAQRPERRVFRVAESGFFPGDLARQLEEEAIAERRLDELARQATERDAARTTAPQEQERPAGDDLEPQREPLATVVPFPPPVGGATAPAPRPSSTATSEQRGGTVTTTNTEAPVETTGLMSALQYADAMNESAMSATVSVELTRSALDQAQVTGDALDALATAQDALASAAVSFRQARDALQRQLSVREAYAATNNEAGDKEFVTSE